MNIQVQPHLCFSGVVFQTLYNDVSSCLQKGTKSCYFVLCNFSGIISGLSVPELYLFL